MIIGDRLRVLREHKKLSQGDIEKRTGLLRCYISRVECGHTVPAVETLEKFARALEVPIYQLFYEGEQPPKLPKLPKRKTGSDILWGSTGRAASLALSFRAAAVPPSRRRTSRILSCGDGALARRSGQHGSGLTALRSLCCAKLPGECRVLCRDLVCLFTSRASRPIIVPAQQEPVERLFG